MAHSPGTWLSGQESQTSVATATCPGHLEGGSERYPGALTGQHLPQPGPASPGLDLEPPQTPRSSRKQSLWPEQQWRVAAALLEPVFPTVPSAYGPHLARGALPSSLLILTMAHHYPHFRGETDSERSSHLPKKTTSFCQFASRALSFLINRGPNGTFLEGSQQRLRCDSVMP